MSDRPADSLPGDGRSWWREPRSWWPKLRSCWARMSSWWRELKEADQFIVGFVAVGFVLSLGTMAAAFWVGVAWGDGYTGYVEALNWVLFPIWFLFVGGAAYLTWTPFNNAWQATADLGLLQLPDPESGSNADTAKEQRDAGVVATDLLGQGWRYLFVLAIVCSILANLLDFREVFEIYLGEASVREADWSVAFTLPTSVSVGQNAFVVWMAFSQQIVLGSLAFLCLFQIHAHVLSFLLPRWILGLQVKLDPFSPRHEFGLEAWNHALNNLYWAFSLALLAPLTSSASNVGHDDGQWVLRVLVPIIIASPMLLTIVGRQQLLPAAYKMVPDPRGEEVNAKLSWELFEKQRLWPVDKNWSSKLGIVLAMVLLALHLGIEIPKIIGP